METTKLDAAQKHILVLIDRDKKADGWTPEGSIIYKKISPNIPTDLAIFEFVDGVGRAKLTPLGQNVVYAMTWL